MHPKCPDSIINNESKTKFFIVSISHNKHENTWGGGAATKCKMKNKRIVFYCVLLWVFVAKNLLNFIFIH